MKILELSDAYNRGSFINYLNDTLLQDFALDEREIGLDANSIFSSMKHLGRSENCEISVFEAVYSQEVSGRRIAITQNAFRVLRQHGVSNALVAFAYGKEQWRLSLLTSKLEYTDGRLVFKQSNPRRYSYLLGKGAKTHTPFKYLIEKGRVCSLGELMQRFSAEVVNKQFYEQIAKHFTELVGGERNGQRYDGLLGLYGVTKPSVKYQEFAVRLIGRIMFCWFLKEKKSVAGVPLVTGKMLSQNAVLENANYYHEVLEPLFFELLNTRQKRRKDIFKEGNYTQIPHLNGGLFRSQAGDYYKFNAATNSDTYGLVTIPDGWFRSLFGVLESYSFTVDENTTYDVELSIDPEMLGRIFENLLAEINPETGESAKKSTGSFYTPRDIVDYMVDTSLLHYLREKTNITEDKLTALISYGQEDDTDNLLTTTENGKVVDALSTLTIIDPACGSGAFPIGILQKVVYILQQVDPNAKLWAAKQYSSVTSTELRQEIKQKEKRGLFDYIRKLGVIRESIFGVDIQTIATEIAKLRCFLSLIVEETVEDDEVNRGIQPLPNLDFKFITANSLLKLESAEEQTGQMTLFEDQTHIDELKRIRNEYFTADTEERAELKTEFKDIQRAMFQATINNYAKNSSNRYGRLSDWNPFENEPTEWFDPEWMFGTKEFDIVIANPPYIHLQHIREQSAYYRTLNFSTYEARGDIYALFYEKGVQLLKGNGLLCYITSNKWMRAAYGKSLRRFFSENTNPIQLIDFAGQQIFDATVDTNILLLSKSANQQATNAVIIKDKDSIANMSVYIKQNSVTIPFTSSDSWAILSPIEQSIKAKIEAVGTPLREWDVKINRGILTGCNDAFIISGAKRDDILCNCATEHERSLTAELIRPILRGRDIKRYGYEFADQHLIALFPSRGYDIENYPAVRDYLLSAEWSDEVPYGHGKEKLEQTGRKHTIGGATFIARKKTGNKWFETQDQIGYWDDFSKQKIIYPNMTKYLPFVLDNNGYCTNQKCFIITGEHCAYLCAFLNSSLFKYCYRENFPELLGGTRELSKVFFDLIKVKKVTDTENVDIGRLVDQIQVLRYDNQDSETTELELDDIIFNIYGLNDVEKQAIGFIEIR